MKFPTDRLIFAKNLCKGKCVLDIGGALMSGCNQKSKFAKTYNQIKQVAKEYKVVDCQRTPNVNFILDFNNQQSAGH